jgi:hypothetical protein
MIFRMTITQHTMMQNQKIRTIIPRPINPPLTAPTARPAVWLPL